MLQKIDYLLIQYKLPHCSTKIIHKLLKHKSTVAQYNVCSRLTAGRPLSTQLTIRSGANSTIAIQTKTKTIIYVSVFLTFIQDYCFIKYLFISYLRDLCNLTKFFIFYIIKSKLLLLYRFNFFYFINSLYMTTSTAYDLVLTVPVGDNETLYFAIVHAFARDCDIAYRHNGQVFLAFTQFCFYFDCLLSK